MIGLAAMWCGLVFYLRAGFATEGPQVFTGKVKDCDICSESIFYNLGLDAPTHSRSVG